MVRTNLLKLCLAALCTFLFLLPVSVQAKDRPFYDSKSNIVGVSGAYDQLVEYGYGEKMFENPVKLKTSLSAPVNKKGYSDFQVNSVLESLNGENAGNRVLRYLFADGDQLSEDMVQQRALKNIQRGDIEFANANYKDAKDVLRDDCLPILTHNYIYLEYRTDKYIAYMVFHVCIDKDVRDQVYATWGNIRGLDRISVPVEFVAMDVVKFDPKKVDYSAISRSLAKNAEAFAIRGQILQRNPAKIDANSQNGVHKGDMVSIYSQRMDNSGKLYSKRISRGRICGVNSKTSQLYFIAGSRGNRKNGDIAVVTRDKKMAVTIDGMWQPHCYAAQVGYDIQIGYSRAGFVSHFLSDLAFAMTDKPGEDFNFEGLEPTYKSPVFLNIGIGYGLSKVFGGFLEVMPYFMAQYEIGMMFDKDSFKYDENDAYNNNKSTDIVGSSIRVPVGLRLDINIAYPFQLTLTGGYAFNFSLGDDETDLTMSYSSIQAACDYLGAKRDGLFFGAGFKIHF